MEERNDVKQSKEGVNYYVFIVFCIGISLTLIVAYILGFSPVKKGELVDCDCYMHLIRASDLYHYGQWYDPVWIKSNAPFGEPLHWSRPFDVLLLAGAIPGSFFTNFETALFWWGIALSPVLMIFALIALNWATRTILNKDGTFLVILFFFPQTVIRSVFQPARPDHHGLLLLFFVLHIGFMLRLILQPFKRSLCYWAAVASAISIWISVESMVPTCISIGVLGFFWIFKEGDYLRKTVHYTFGLFVFCGLCLIAERPFQYLTLVKYDSISLIYVSIMGFVALFSISASVLNLATVLLKQYLGRLGYSVSGICLIAIAVHLFFPKLYQGPFAEVDPRIMTLWFKKTSEIASLLSGSVSLGTTVQFIGVSAVSFLFLFHLIFLKKDTANRRGWMYITLSSVLLSLIAIFQMRWSIYPYTLFSIVMAELLYRLLNYKNENIPIVWRTIKNSLITLILTLGFLYTGVFAQKILRKPSQEKKYKKPPLSEICDFLNQYQRQDNQSLKIMISPFFAAEILYRTNHEVVATANTYGQGILDTYDVISADRDDAAFAILQKRRIDIILLCPASAERVMFSKPGQRSNFYQRLIDDQIPDWLHKIQLPDDLSASFLLFEVNYINHSSTKDVSR